MTRWWYVQFEENDDFKPVDWWPAPPPEESLDEDHRAAFKDAEGSGRFDERPILRMFVADDSGEQDRIVWTHNVGEVSAMNYFRLREVVAERLKLLRQRVG